RILFAQTAGSLFGRASSTLGTLGIFGMLAKGGTLALLGKAGLILLALAAAAGIGYGLYTLFRPRQPAPTQTTSALPPTVSTPSTYVNNVSFQPTIIVPQGTTTEQAQYILEQIKKETPKIFGYIRWQERGAEREKAVRQIGLYNA
ncbi:MAG: hypothetical protein NZ651_06675, partial [Candidatus Bipolaricaulota bacterium]|nr:hypothetical protein [Candidatus Bipolaricaulota bacterium]MDW8127438.1 hypothetical protein [Candidatus Bipolaricaulota bacterium]